MARPVWITKPGDLGIIAERQFYNLRFDVYDADDGALTYSIVGGNLPAGLSLKDDGFIEGIPTVRKVFIRGVPTDVVEDVVSRFSVRVQTTTGQVADRTFTLTVSGQDAPVITSVQQDLGIYFDGSYFEYQFTATDLDNDSLTWTVNNGTLPNGLELDSTTGVLSGFLNVAVNENYGDPGWVDSQWDTFPWDFGIKGINQNFQFTISVTDGKDYALMTYKVFIYSKDLMTADTDVVTVDTDNIITADTTNKRTPVLLTREQDLGVILHDNYFAFKFDGRDFDGDNILYQLFSGDESGFDLLGTGFDEVPFDQGALIRPPGLNLDEDTGWFYGYIPAQALLEQEYQIGIRVVKKDYPDTYRSRLQIFTFTIIGDLGKFVQWTTPTNIGTMSNGDISEFYVEATNGLGRNLSYRLADDRGTGTLAWTDYGFTGDGSTTTFNVGYDIRKLPVQVMVEETVLDPSEYTIIQSFVELDSPPDVAIPVTISVKKGNVDSNTSTVYSGGKLPQGLKLLPDGLISGQVSFNGFTMDGGSTSFDVIGRRTSSATAPTTFDTVYNFTVEVYDDEGDINTFKDFSITVTLDNKIPYDSLYAEALLNRTDRSLLTQLTADTDVINPAYVYRLQDPFFGISNQIRILVASGIYPASAETLQDAVTRNHYNKRIQLGDIKTARALNSDGTVRYEVVYADVSDDKQTPEGASTALSANLGNVYISGGYNPVIYPNSFQNMRSVVYTAVTQVNKNVLPDWMTSKQEDGTILGHINAVVLCYTIPGKSKSVSYNIATSNSGLDRFDIVLDRYVWDNNLSEHYDIDTASFTATTETTFDKFANGSSFTLAATVDFAVESPYSSINGKPISEVAASGVVDGINNQSLLINKTIIFAKQENYSVTTEEAWTNFNSKFAEDAFDSTNFDQAEVIPGYFDLVNQRPGVYKITLNTSNVVELVLQQVIDTEEQVNVRIGGLKYGGAQLFLDPSVKTGNSAPDYSSLESLIEGEKTTFDNNGTKFLSFKDLYTVPDENDTYIKWPQLGVFQ